MTVAGLVGYMKRYGIGISYRRDEILKGKKTTPSSNRKRIRLSSAGSDIYLCKRAKEKIATGRPVLRNRPSKACGCKARFTIQFSNGYRHGPSDEINVADYGDKIVKVTWNWKHKHDFNDPELFAELPLSTDAKSLLRIAVLDYGVTWHQILREQTKVWQSDNPSHCELSKINARHVRYILKESTPNQPFKGKSIVDSFGILANIIQSSGGFAEYTTKFKSLDGRNDLEDLENSRRREVWSFCFMSAWQRDVLRQNPEIIHLDSTHETCFGLRRKKNAYLFTICVKNQKAGAGAPCAFMLSNTGIAPVIADFLRKVESFTGIVPSQVVIDCDQAESAALKAVWGPELPITYCLFHVDRAFKKHLHLKTKPCADKEDIKLIILEDFKKVLASRSAPEAQQNISWFLKKHEVHDEFVAYVDKQWFAKKEFIIEGLNPKYVRGENTNNLLESFHALLKSATYVGGRCDRRPDALAYELFTFVAPSFMGKERKAEFGFAERIYDKAETLAKEKAMEISNAEVKERVFLSGEGQLTVQSITDSKTSYLVHLEAAGQAKNTCTCPVNCSSGSLCKHIFLAERFWKAKSSPQANLSEASDSADLTSTDTSSSQLLKAVATSNDLSLFDSVSSPEEDLESLPDCEAQGPAHDSHQSSDFMAAQSTMAVDADIDDDVDIGSNMTPARLSEETSHTRAEERNDCVAMQGPSRSQEQTHNITGSQEARQTKDREKERSLYMIDQKILESVKRVSKGFREVYSVEGKARAADSFEIFSREFVLGLRKLHAKQRH